jgi:hypothetical protein
MKQIFETCEPRSEVLKGEPRDDIFAARLRDVPRLPLTPFTCPWAIAGRYRGRIGWLPKVPKEGNAFATLAAGHLPRSPAAKVFLFRFQRFP